MPCYKPIKINKNGYRDLQIQVPCGQCLGCRIERASDWAARCLHESRMHELNIFVTLTYDDDKLPASGSLVKKDFQNFMRYLRRHHYADYRKANNVPDNVPDKSLPGVRFYAAGEYGDQTLRPHYHALLFGIDFADKRPHSQNGQSDPLFTSETLTKIWGKGHCLIGAVTYQSAGYVARYCIKKVNGQLADSHYAGREPEFGLMSLKPGIGAGWLKQNQSDVYPSDFLIVQGRKKSPPRYYDDKLKSSDPLMLDLLKKRRFSIAKTYRKDQTPARLKVRMECLEARLTLRKSTL